MKEVTKAKSCVEPLSGPKGVSECTTKTTATAMYVLCLRERKYLLMPAGGSSLYSSFMGSIAKQSPN